MRTRPAWGNSYVGGGLEVRCSCGERHSAIFVLVAAEALVFADYNLLFTGAAAKTADSFAA